MSISAIDNWLNEKKIIQYRSSQKRSCIFIYRPTVGIVDSSCKLESFALEDEAVSKNGFLFIEAGLVANGREAPLVRI